MNVSHVKMLQTYVTRLINLRKKINNNKFIKTRALSEVIIVIIKINNGFFKIQGGTQLSQLFILL